MRALLALLLLCSAAFGQDVRNQSGAQLPGTSAADNAAAGNVGEFISVAPGQVSLTSGVATNLASISLTPGDWDVYASALFTGNATTTVSYQEISISTTSASHNFLAGAFTSIVYSGTPAIFATANVGMAAGVYRVSIATTTTVYAVASSAFATSTQTAGAVLRARRVR